MSGPQRTPEDPRLDAALRAIDEKNAADPRTVLVDGRAEPKELVYGRRMSAQLARLAPEASPELRLAARAHHVCRWRIPRDTHPSGRVGYRRWRSELARMHADVAAEILREVGYDDATIARVGDLILEKRLRTDPEAQLLEDVACVVFLEHYLEEFATGREDGDVVAILRKTWAKMGERGRKAALELELGPRAARLVRAALEP